MLGGRMKKKDLPKTWAVRDALTFTGTSEDPYTLARALVEHIADGAAVVQLSIIYVGARDAPFTGVITTE